MAAVEVVNDMVVVVALALQVLLLQQTQVRPVMVVLELQMIF